ncbi:hypothetical protein MHBO_001100, partial [Bonamia ostreae]
MGSAKPDSIKFGKAFKIISGWQFVTFLLAGTLVFTDLLKKNHTSLPSLQSTFAYLLVTIIFLPAFFVKEGFRLPKEPLWKFMLIGLLDVEGNFMIILAFRYTSITSVSLLNVSTTIFVAIFSWQFLKFKFRIYHLVFIVITVIGMTLLILTDVIFSEKSFTEGKPWQQILLGDGLVVLGCFFYSIENVTQEDIVKKEIQFYEYLAFFGLCGFVICTVQGFFVD